MEHNGICDFFCCQFQRSMKFFMKLNTTILKKKPRAKIQISAQSWLFHRQILYRHLFCRQTLHWKKNCLQTHRQIFHQQDIYFAGGCWLRFKMYFLWKVYIIWQLIQVSLWKKECPSFFSSEVAYKFVNIIENIS